MKQIKDDQVKTVSANDLKDRIEKFKKHYSKTPKKSFILQDEEKGWHLALEFFLSFLVMGGIGFSIDYYFHTKPWFMLIGFVLGFIVGLYRLIKKSHINDAS